MLKQKYNITDKKERKKRNRKKENEIIKNEFNKNILLIFQKYFFQNIENQKINIDKYLDFIITIYSKNNNNKFNSHLLLNFILINLMNYLIDLIKQNNKNNELNNNLIFCRNMYTFVKFLNIFLFQIPIYSNKNKNKNQKQNKNQNKNKNRNKNKNNLDQNNIEKDMGNQDEKIFSLFQNKHNFENIKKTININYNFKTGIRIGFNNNWKNLLLINPFLDLLDHWNIFNNNLKFLNLKNLNSNLSKKSNMKNNKNRINNDLKNKSSKNSHSLKIFKLFKNITSILHFGLIYSKNQDLISKIIEKSYLFSIITIENNLILTKKQKNFLLCHVLGSLFKLLSKSERGKTSEEIFSNSKSMIIDKLNFENIHFTTEQILISHIQSLLIECHYIFKNYLITEEGKKILSNNLNNSIIVKVKTFKLLEIFKKESWKYIIKNKFYSSIETIKNELIEKNQVLNLKKLKFFDYLKNKYPFYLKMINNKKNWGDKNYFSKEFNRFKKKKNFLKQLNQINSKRLTFLQYEFNFIRKIWLNKSGDTALFKKRISNFEDNNRKRVRITNIIPKNLKKQSKLTNELKDFDLDINHFINGIEDNNNLISDSTTDIEYDKNYFNLNDNFINNNQNFNNDDYDDDNDVIIDDINNEQELWKIKKTNNQLSNKPTNTIDGFGFNIKRKYNKDEGIIKVKCQLIIPSRIINGYLIIFSHSINFISLNKKDKIDDDDSINNNNNNNNDNYKEESQVNEKINSDQDKSIKYNWDFKKIKDIQKRRYLWKNNALEIFLKNNLNYFFNIIDKKTDSSLLLNIIKKTASLINPTKNWQLNTSVSEKLLIFQRSWRNGKISNFDYLMKLNTLSGRTYNDLNQYPIFPWVLKDYESEEINLDDPDVYRDLSKPIFSFNKKRILKLIKSRSDVGINSEEFENDDSDHYDNEGDQDNYCKGHYSTISTVLNYLHRIEPYTTIALNWNKNNNTLRNFTFLSVQEHWLKCNNSITIYDELIPEFYYMPEFLENINNLNYLFQQNEKPIEKIILPPWAKGSVENFIKIMKEALESDYVSKHLNEWIDLIFGYKQRGEDAIKLFNVYHPFSYEDGIINKKIKKHQIEKYGYTPLQLFIQKHPKKIPNNKILNNQLISKKQQILINSINQGDNKTDKGTDSDRDRDSNYNNDENDKVNKYDYLYSNVHNFDPYKIKKIHTLNYDFSNNNKILFIKAFFNMDTLMKNNIIHNVISFDSNRHLIKMKLIINNFQDEKNIDYILNRKEYQQPIRKIGYTFDLKIYSFINCFDFLQNGNYFISCGYWDNTFKINNIKNQKLIKNFNQHKDVVTCLKVKNDLIITGSRDTTIIVWQMTDENFNLKLKKIIFNHEYEILSIDFLKKLDLIISLDSSGLIFMHSIKSGKYLNHIDLFNTYNAFNNKEEGKQKEEKTEKEEKEEKPKEDQKEEQKEEKAKGDYDNDVMNGGMREEKIEIKNDQNNLNKDENNVKDMHANKKRSIIKKKIKIKKHSSFIKVLSMDNCFLIYVKSEFRLFTINCKLVWMHKYNHNLTCYNITKDEKYIIVGNKEGNIEIRSIWDFSLIKKFLYNHPISSVDFYLNSNLLFIGLENGKIIIEIFKDSIKH
ncbi:beige/beach-related [Anaeramoeba flamelloides]|uniref:Beige/beach-related n=1 Tax=Anaeramoeba flamelloides TaxID=1746091 RepID=A0AAV7YZQ9_9EUKA|nr:beige/beach-related [Anaeramoeba flamelloides]